MKSFLIYLTMSPKVKICCISSIEEAKMAIDFGASAIGLVAKMPSGPGPIEDSLIYTIAKSIPPPIATFMLTSETTAPAIIEHHKRTQTNTIQIVDEMTEGSYKDIKIAFPYIKLVQVIHVVDEKSIDEAVIISGLVDALLLDSGNPRASKKELGGTGRVHNWKWSRTIVENSRVPVFLAGGITAENVNSAIEQVNPFGIDLCSGVRTNGKLDPNKLKALFKVVYN
jgi:phosphoribosylanthranilate isomerase